MRIDNHIIDIETVARKLMCNTRKLVCIAGKLIRTVAPLSCTVTHDAKTMISFMRVTVYAPSFTLRKGLEWLQIVEDSGEQHSNCLIKA